MDIGKFGLAYAGTGSLANLSSAGYRVVGADIDNDRLQLVSEGTSSIVESGILELTEDAIGSNPVMVTNNTDEAIH